MKQGTFYITTPIYYPSDKLHIGHTYCTVATDAIARYKRMRGFDVMFLTGTDEHGMKIEERARENGLTPREFVDNIVIGRGGILDLWKLMNISNDRFIRTTDDYHVSATQRIFKKMYDNGDIYKGAYKGLYCSPCESFWTESQLVDGKCPDCGREVKYAEEEAYFFRLSKYQDRIMKLYQDDPGFLEPGSRVNEMVNNFLKPGLDDLCVSRTSFTWGIPVDFDPGHVVYVWVDALSNYATALGYMNDRYDDFDKYWPPDVHIVGKEIVRFHAIIWPAMLMSLNEPLPKKVFGHGWLLLDGGKMSKSKGNVVDPVVLVDRYGVDALRFFLLREFPFGSDGNFSNELLISRINADLANDLGNLVSRSVAMVERYFSSTLPPDRQCDELDDPLVNMGAELRSKYEEQMEKLSLQNALAEVFHLVSRSNKYIDETAPWTLAKDPENNARLATVLYNLLESIRLAAVLLTPFMPDSCGEILRQIGASPEESGYDSCATWGALSKTATVSKGRVLFPRLDLEKELKELDIALPDSGSGQPAEVEDSGGASVEPEYIEYADFEKVQLVCGEILECESIPKSDKLLKLQIDIGSETRQIVSGIAQWYAPEMLTGKKVVVVSNLKPAKLFGVESCGMILASDDNDAANVLFLDPSTTNGSKVR